MTKDIESQNRDNPAEHSSGSDVYWADNNDTDELSEILGFDLSDVDGQDRSGLRALINSSLVAHRRLPVLEAIFDRAARLMTTSLRLLTNDNVEARLDDVSTTRFGEFLEGLPKQAMVAVIRSDTLDNYILLALDGDLVFSIVDVLLGGRRDGAAHIDDRGFTPIELALTQNVVEHIVESLTGAFSLLGGVDFSLDRIETTPRFAAIAQSASVCALAKYRVELEGRGGRVAILAPHAALEPIQKKLAREFIGDAIGPEKTWRDELSRGVNAAMTDLRAVIAECELSISKLRTLRVGEIVSFGATINPIVEVRAGDVAVACGRVGQANGNIALRLIGEPAQAPTDGDAHQ